MRIYQGADTAAPVSGFSMSPGDCFDGIGIDDLMKGSWADVRRFYANFKSKEELMAKSCERTLAELVETKVTSKAKREPLRAIVAGYLSISHRDDPANGCVVAALGAGVARKSPAVRQAVTEGVRPFIDFTDTKRPRSLGSRAPQEGAGDIRESGRRYGVGSGGRRSRVIETNTYGCSGIGVTAFSSLRCGFS